MDFHRCYELENIFIVQFRQESDVYDISDFIRSDYAHYFDKQIANQTKSSRVLWNADWFRIKTPEQDSMFSGVPVDGPKRQ